MTRRAAVILAQKIIATRDPGETIGNRTVSDALLRNICSMSLTCVWNEDAGTFNSRGESIQDIARLFTLD